MTKNQIQYWTLQEQKRANKAGEQETYRSNLARETETNRANLAKEKENSQHNRATEVQAINELGEARRSHQINEGIAINQLQEQRRSNLAQESLASVVNAIATERNRLQAIKNQQDYAVGLENVRTKDEANTINRVRNVLSGEMNQSEINLNSKQVEKLAYDISSVIADTSLTEQQKQNEIVKTINNAIKGTSDAASLINALFKLFS